MSNNPKVGYTVTETEQGIVVAPAGRPIVNDYMNNGHPDRRDPQHRWNGVRVNGTKKALSQEVLSAVAAESQRLKRPLTDEERNAVYSRFEN